VFKIGVLNKQIDLFNVSKVEYSQRVGWSLDRVSEQQFFKGFVALFFA
jgi:hypothetical protein